MKWFNQTTCYTTIFFTVLQKQNHFFRRLNDVYKDGKIEASTCVDIINLVALIIIVMVKWSNHK